jgi:hypothetical protein
VCLADVDYLIVQHLSSRDVLNFMEVSSEWNKIALAASKQMSRIKLNLKNRSRLAENEIESLKVLDKSKRKYQKAILSFRCIPSPINPSPKLILLQKFSENLVELEIQFDNHILLGLAPQTLKLPKLKNLTISGFAAKAFARRVEFAAPILDRLVLRGVLYMRIFNEGKVDEFLEQFTNLTFLFLDIVSRKALKVILNRLPKLKTFHSYEFDDEVEEIDADFQPNQSITEVKFKANSKPDFNRKFVKLFVNLEKCEVRNFDLEHVEIVEWMIRNKFKIRKIHLTGQKFPMRIISTIYDELKTSNEIVNEQIEITWMLSI